MINISGFGMKAQLVADSTFPSGFTISEWSDETDAVDVAHLTVAEAGYGPNGDMVWWSRVNGIDVTLNVIPDSDSEVNLTALVDANRAAKGKGSAKDSVSLVFTWPDGRIVTCEPGIVVVGDIAPSMANSGRMKTRSYQFKFEQIAQTNPGAGAA